MVMAHMANNFAAIDAQIARLESLGDFVSDAAPEVADELRLELEKQVKAGVTPDGEVWKPRQDDGGKPLQNASAAIVVVPVGTSIFCRLKGPEARHSRGIARGGIVRQVLPTTLPESWSKKIGMVLRTNFEKLMGVK